MRTLLALLLLAPILACANLDLAGVEPPQGFGLQPPTEYVSGAALDPATEIAQYNLYCRHASDDYPTEPYVIDGFLPAGEQNVSVDRDLLTLKRGAVTCVMTAVDVAGVMSLPSNELDLVWRGPARGFLLRGRD